jgi:hypothetical protein
MVEKREVVEKGGIILGIKPFSQRHLPPQMIWSKTTEMFAEAIPAGVVRMYAFVIILTMVVFPS